MYDFEHTGTAVLKSHMLTRAPMLALNIQLVAGLGVEIKNGWRSRRRADQGFVPESAVSSSTGKPHVDLWHTQTVLLFAGDRHRFFLSFRSFVGYICFSS